SLNNMACLLMMN
ncbi:putative thiamine biosynthesis protein, partial [Haemophilus influenzae]